MDNPVKSLREESYENNGVCSLCVLSEQLQIAAMLLKRDCHGAPQRCALDAVAKTFSTSKASHPSGCAVPLPKFATINQKVELNRI